MWLSRQFCGYRVVIAVTASDPALLICDRRQAAAAAAGVPVAQMPSRIQR